MHYKGGYMSSKKLLMTDELINILVESGKAETYVIHKSDSENGLLDRDETRLLLIYGTEVPGLYVMDSFNNDIYTYYKAKNDSVSMKFKKLRDADKSCIKIYYSYTNDKYSWVYNEP